MKKNLFILSASAFLLFACGTHKAHHKGISYSKMPTWKANKKAETTENQEFQADLQGGQAEVVNVEKESFTQPIFASTDVGLSALITEDQNLVLENEIRDVTLAAPVIAAPSDTCDEIILRNGEIISGKIVEISPEFVKYKKCDYLSGPKVVINKSDVFMLQYFNGTNEVFEITKKDKTQNSNEVEKPNPNVAYFKEKKADKLATRSLLSGIAGLFPVLGFPFSILSIIYGAIGIIRTADKKGKRDKSRIKAIIAHVLGIVGTCVSIFAFIYVFL